MWATQGGDRSSANERRWVGRGGGESKQEASCSEKRLLYMSSNPPPPPPPLLNALVAIIPASQLHYSPHSIDLKSNLLISTHTHTHARIYVVGPKQCISAEKKLMHPWCKSNWTPPLFAVKNHIKVILKCILLKGGKQRSLKMNQKCYISFEDSEWEGQGLTSEPSGVRVNKCIMLAIVCKLVSSAVKE